MTTKKDKEEKRMMFFDMQEHSERYTDEQVEALLADEDIKELFHGMAMARMAQRKANPEKVNVDEAWKMFAARQGIPTVNIPKSGNRFKVAASITGFIFLSGITFAAIRSGVFRSLPSNNAPKTNAELALPDKRDSAKANVAVKSDTLNLKPVVFDNAELGDVVSQLAAFYHVKTEFQNEKARHVRIFFNWDKTKTLQRNIEILNAIDRIQITYSPSKETLEVK